MLKIDSIRRDSETGEYQLIWGQIDELTKIASYYSAIQISERDAQLLLEFEKWRHTQRKIDEYWHYE